MKTENNAKYAFTEEIIETALLNLIKRKRYDGFTVKDLCAEAGINRSTFYAHYDDINDLNIKFERKLSQKIRTIWTPVDTDILFDINVLTAFFSFVKEYKDFYKSFLKSHTPSFLAHDMLTTHILLAKTAKPMRDMPESEIDYHLHFFGGGLKALCGRWIQNDCRETPEKIARIIFDEYTDRGK